MSNLMHYSNVPIQVLEYADDTRLARTVASPVFARHLQLGPPDNKDWKLGVFEFVLVVIIVTTVCKVAERRMARPRRDDSLPSGTDELLRVRDTMADLSGRLERLEEERDFYKALLEPEVARRELPTSETLD
jgi:hypothetical protein